MTVKANQAGYAQDQTAEPKSDCLSVDATSLIRVEHKMKTPVEKQVVTKSNMTLPLSEQWQQQQFKMKTNFNQNDRKIKKLQFKSF